MGEDEERAWVSLGSEIEIKRQMQLPTEALPFRPDFFFRL